MTFKTIKTGSGGNCFRLDDLIIDAGIPYSSIIGHLDGVDFILLTHEHGDHFRTDTIRKVLVYHENIKILCGAWMKDLIVKSGGDANRIIEVEPGNVYDIGEYKISPVVAYHDVENFGYRIMKNGHKHFHITDTATLDGIEAVGYDSASIECNHHLGKALELIREAKDNGEFSHLNGAINSHLSVEETILFCKYNRIGKLYPIHIGSSTRKEVIQALKDW